MKKRLLILCLLLSVLTGRAQAVADYNDSWNRPTIGHASFDFGYVYFGMVPPGYRKPGIDIHSLPPIPGLKYRSYSNYCPKDTCDATRVVLAVRCPEDSVLLQLASGRVAEYVERSITHDKVRKALVASSADICNQYIRQIRKKFDQFQCTGEGDHDVPNEQFGYLLTDCWRTEQYCTFYESTWYDWLSCGDNTTESYYSVDVKTGRVASITDFIQERDLTRLATLMMKYLKNFKGDLWYHPDFEWVPTDPLELLKAMNGCALIREGLIIYYHPYEIGCGADGQFNAVIPYKELTQLLANQTFTKL